MKDCLRQSLESDLTPRREYVRLGGLAKESTMVATQKQMDALEGLVDSAGLAIVLVALSNICNAKADHVREAWQDEALAARWEAAAVRIRDEQAEHLYRGL